jgi:AraC family transcriptional regulator
MIENVSTASYPERLRRVIDYVHDRLDDPLELSKLAEVACFSPYHFHRIYRAIIGETVADTVTRLRLQRASHDLARTQQPLAVIARRAGYGSMAAFSRAFRSAYKQTPSAFRASAPTSGDQDMTVLVQDREPMRLLTVAHSGPAHEIGKAFDKLVAWAGPRALLRPSAQGVAVYLDDMGASPSEEQRALAGLTVDEDVEGDDAVSIHIVPGGPHAMILYQGPYAKIGQAYNQLYKWLAAKNQEPANAPMFEVNLNNPRNTPPDELLTEICVPLR